MDKLAKEEKDAAWGYNEKGEPRWPAALAVILAVVLYISLPDRFISGPIWLLPLLQAAFLIPLFISAPRRHQNEQPWQRLLAILVIAVINLYNIFSLCILIDVLTHPHKYHALNGEQLLITAAQIWLTNVIVFGLWYWELDRGGPAARCKTHHRYPDFLYPQMVTPEATTEHWVPNFMDYLYVSFTNATAFSPTDTMPLTHWAKLLMMVQAFASLVTVALVAARAINILA